MTVAVVTGASSGHRRGHRPPARPRARRAARARRAPRGPPAGAGGGAAAPASAPATSPRTTRPGGCAPTSRSATTASTCSSTTPARRGGRRSPTAAGRTSSATWRSTSTPCVRLTEALLPLLRRSAPSAIVNVSSTAGRVARPGSGAYSASKFALAGWSDALAGEEAPHGVHVGLVLPGLHHHRGLPAVRAERQPAARAGSSRRPSAARRRSSTPGSTASAERYVPRPYGLAAAARVLAPRLVRLATGRKAGERLVPRTRRRRREVSALARSHLPAGVRSW